MADLNKLRLDLDTVDKGRWCVYHEDFAVLIASTKNREFEAAQRRIASGVSRGFRNGSMADDEQRGKKFQRAFIETCVLGWRNLEIDGKKINFTVEKALEIMLDREFADLYSFCFEEASDQAEYAAVNLEARAKN